LSKAVFNAADALGLAQRDLAAVIGVSDASVSRMKDGTYAVSGKPFELAACLVRVFRSLDAIAGGDPDTVKGWMRNANDDLHAVPRDMIRSAQGLITVMTYLDANRAPT